MGRTTNVLVTGANGFVGKNLCLRLSDLDEYTVSPVTRDTKPDEFESAVGNANVVVHLAGVNRPDNPAAFSGNFDSVMTLTEAIARTGRKIRVICSSSTKAAEESPYGSSKKKAEDSLLAFAETNGSPVAIMRLPNLFGKWCRPNYNSAVATFCHNVARGLSISVNDPAASISLLYIDDLIDQIINLIEAQDMETGFVEVGNVHETTVGEVAGLIQAFHEQRSEAQIDNVGTGLTRALYATYISYLLPEDFSYELVSHRDARGAFSEMLKTREAGQFSYFNAHPGVTRGGHYHHTKTEKFLVVHGQALFKFRHMLTSELHEVRTSADTPVVVDTIPGWSHSITNVGDEIMVCLLWANEIFDRQRPDTIAAEV